MSQYNTEILEETFHKTDMKRILLVGEYSGVFTELSKELKKRKDLDVFTVNDGDGYKNYPADLHVACKKFNHSFLGKVIYYISFRLGLLNILDFISNWRILKKSLSCYDIVLITNPVMFSEWGAIPNLIILRYLKKHNDSVFLSVLGFDYYELKYNRIHNNTSGFYTPRLKDYIIPNYVWKYKFCLFYRFLNDYSAQIAKKIIPGLLPYKQCYEWTGKTSKLIPFPVNDTLLGSPIKVDESQPIIIFHGWQKGKESYKGNDVFDRVIKKVVDKYGDKVDYRVVQGVSYDVYIRSYSDCHIFIDQLYFPDKGFNAVLGMAKGKVVFSGFSEEALRAYPNYNGEQVGINAYNDEKYLFEQFCNLIDNPKRIEHISKNAIEFVKNNHLSKLVADMYMHIWFDKTVK